MRDEPLDRAKEGAPGGPTPGESPADHVVQVQQLFVKHQSALKAFILSLQPNYAEAEDILQEVFLVVTRKAGQFVPGSNFLGWAFTIARLKVLEALRRRKTAEQSLSEQTIETLCATPPEEGFFEARLAAVRTCLEKLAPRMQEVVRMRYFAEHGPSEIARLLSWTPNSVNVTLSKARKFVYECVLRKLREE